MKIKETPILSSENGIAEIRKKIKKTTEEIQGLEIQNANEESSNYYQNTESEELMKSVPGNEYIPSSDFNQNEITKKKYINHKLTTLMKNKEAEAVIRRQDLEAGKSYVEPKGKKVLQTEKYEKEVNLAQIAEILKNNKIDQIIIGGREVQDLEALKIDPNSKEKVVVPNPDLDTRTALYLLNNFTNQEMYQDDAIVSSIGKNGNGKNSVPQKKGVIVYLDTGGEWMKIEKEGEVMVLYIDHHGVGKKDPTSGTKMMQEILSKAGVLKEIPPWLQKFIDFVNDIDNLSYVDKLDEKGREIFTENYFRNEWPNSLYALAENDIPFETLIDLCARGVIKDPSKPFTIEELNGELGQTKIKTARGEINIKELCKKQQEKVKKTLDTGIKNSVKHNKDRGLNLENTNLGKIIYHDYYSIKGKMINTIDDRLAFKATKAKGYQTYIAWNKEPKDGSGGKFYINSTHQNLSSIVEALNAAHSGCAKDVRGVMVFGKMVDDNGQTITEEEFFNIIDKEIYKGVKEKEEKEKNLIKKVKPEIHTDEPESLEIKDDEVEKKKTIDKLYSEIIEMIDRSTKSLLREKELENELTQLIASSKKEATEPTKKIEAKPFSFNIEFIKNKIQEIIANNEGIKKIEGFSIIPGPNNEFILNVKKITAEFNFIFTFTTDITIKNARIVNFKDGIRLNDDYEMTATNYEKKVKNKMAQNIDKISGAIKEIIEKEVGKKVEKVWIEDGELKAL